MWTQPERKRALRDAAAKAAQLLRIDAKPLVPDLILVLEDASEPFQTRSAARRALETIGTEHGIMLTVMSNLIGDPDPLTAAGAARGLVQRQDRRVRKDIQAMMADHARSNMPPLTLDVDLTRAGLSLDAK
jgi:HEAT repeat protein